MAREASPTVHVFAIGPSARESQGRDDTWVLDLVVTKSPLHAGLKQQILLDAATLSQPDRIAEKCPPCQRT